MSKLPHPKNTEVPSGAPSAAEIANSALRALLSGLQYAAPNSGHTKTRHARHHSMLGRSGGLIGQLVVSPRCWDGALDGLGEASAPSKGQAS